MWIVLYFPICEMKRVAKNSNRYSCVLLHPYFKQKTPNICLFHPTYKTILLIPNSTHVHEHSRLASLPLRVPQTSLQQPHLVPYPRSSNSNNLFDSLNMFVRSDRPNPLVHSYGRYSLPKESHYGGGNQSELVDYRSSRGIGMNYSSINMIMQPFRTRWTGRGGALI